MKASEDPMGSPQSGKTLADLHPDQGVGGGGACGTTGRKNSSDGSGSNDAAASSKGTSSNGVSTRGSTKGTGTSGSGATAGCNGSGADQGAAGGVCIASGGVTFTWAGAGAVGLAVVSGGLRASIAARSTCRGTRSPLRLRRLSRLLPGKATLEKLSGLTGRTELCIAIKRWVMPYPRLKQHPASSGAIQNCGRRAGAAAWGSASAAMREESAVLGSLAVAPRPAKSAQRQVV